MYKRNTQGWLKHLDFILLDMASLQLAFLLAVRIRHNTLAYAFEPYRSLGWMLLLVDAVVLVLHNSMHKVVSRGYYVEAIATLQHCAYVFAVAAVYMLATQTGDVYSRIVVFLTFLFHVVIGYLIRILWKRVLKKYSSREPKSTMLVVAEPDTAEAILDRLSSGLADYRITGVVLTEETSLKEVGGYPIVSDLDGAADYIVREWVDSVYIDASLARQKVLQLMDDCATMAVPTHYHLPNMSRNNVKQFAEKVGGTTVLTSSINYATPGQVFLKRCFDILVGLVGSLAALVIMAIVGPVIKKQSPGPILFTQERVGQNGKRFKMYKIRSMYMDAEERKQELMAQNRVKDGMMFKLDFDPRIIGNEILPDGTRKTGIGEFIRRTSLDEFPQFFCVLMGTMSTVGTRPPTVDEYMKYKYHHKARLATKPGITGMWQVSGRSEITDFEEVVRLDTQYISNWSPGLDLRILFKTVSVILTRKGAL